MIALTFDSDYMTDELFEDFFKTVMIPGSGTFFLHQKFSEQHFDGHEIGLHPFLEHSPDTWIETTSNLMKVYSRKIKGIRAHSCVNSQPFHGQLSAIGIRYVSHTTPFKRLNVEPYLMPWGIWELPVKYMDNMDYCWDLNCPPELNKKFDRDFLASTVGAPECVHVFDFHPIHILMNTPNYEFWAKNRGSIGQVSIGDLRYEGRGVATYFDELLKLMIAHNQKSNSCLDIID